MKELTVSKVEFDDFVYPAIAAARDANIKELRLSNDILNKLEKQSEKESLKDRCPMCGNPAVFAYKLIEIEAIFNLENAEADHLLGRLQQMIPNIQSWRAREMLPIINQLKAD